MEVFVWSLMSNNSYHPLRSFLIVQCSSSKSYMFLANQLRQFYKLLGKVSSIESRTKSELEIYAFGCYYLRVISSTKSD